MIAVLLIIHLLLIAAMVAVILMQRSEGGALGIGGGPGGMMSGRGSANLLTRTTMILGALFVGNSILLAVLASVDDSGRSVIDRLGDDPATQRPFDFSGFDDIEEEGEEIPDESQPEPAQDDPEIPGR
ncbi:preprotein translocase subunit SecG [Alkalicaulis satelles]|uniref:Protein-export membrane protein SecG n=1 Tax=Alkalicaulis satelles TaxID=2609175 RepID=A0A5M6ZMA2_9PROT|nr:preprotein translocase subunit SecG [Alkalicaulis satelles]KAA5804834.1 preprotein translocase subunit SecG [Alkalicaulis satelles]